MKNKTKDFRTNCNEEMGYISGIFMSQGDTRAGDIIMPSRELLEATDRLCLYLFGEVEKAKQEERNKKQKCNHDFRYSHIEYPPLGDYSIIPPEKDVVVCRKCGKIIKTIMPSEIGDGGTNYPNIETFLN